jgi:hypothetical protein
MQWLCVVVKLPRFDIPVDVESGPLPMFTVTAAPHRAAAGPVGASTFIWVPVKAIKAALAAPLPRAIAAHVATPRAQRRDIRAEPCCITHSRAFLAIPPQQLASGCSPTAVRC